MLCPCAGLPLWQGGAPNAQPAHLLAGTLAALFSAAVAAPSLAAGLLRQSHPSTKRETPPSHLSNYRPVAVGTPIARLYTSILNNRISPYLEAEISGRKHRRASARVLL